MLSDEEMSERRQISDGRLRRHFIPPVGFFPFQLDLLQIETRIL